MLTEVTTNSSSLQQTVSLCTEMMSAYPKLRQKSLENVEVHFKGWFLVAVVVVVVVLFGWEGNREELLGLGFLLFSSFCLFFGAGGLSFSGAGVALLTGFYQCMKTGQVCTEYHD